jgi:hypothetical protein
MKGTIIFLPSLGEILEDIKQSPAKPPRFLLCPKIIITFSVFHSFNFYPLPHQSITFQNLYHKPGQ